MNITKIGQYLLGYIKNNQKELEKKIIEFQKMHGLKPTGKFNNNTIYELIAAAPVAKKSKVKKNVNYAWQTFLGIECDGIFGNETLVKTKDFQKKNDLVDDGEVGPKTWCKALGISVPKYIIKQPVNYKQIDKRWKDIIYTYNGTHSKKQTIGNSGCGPTSMSDIVATYWDSKITPVEMCKLAVDKGYRRKTGGIDGKFLLLSHKNMAACV